VGYNNNGCSKQWGAPSNGWGAQYGGISNREACDVLPDPLKNGCYWRYDWFLGAINPNITFTEVACPTALTKNTGCIRANNGSSFEPSTSSSISSQTSNTLMPLVS
jgi:hypothetical protein